MACNIYPACAFEWKEAAIARTAQIDLVLRNKVGNVAQELHQTRAVLVLRYLFERRLANFDFFFRNFERPFTPQTWLRSARNFAKTRFRWSPTFHFSTPTNIFGDKNFCRKKFSSTPRKIFQQSACFGGAVQVYTPLSNADRKFIARHIGFSLLRPLAEG